LAIRPKSTAFLQDAGREMLRKFMTQIPEETSLVNFILEARELKTLANFNLRWNSLVGWLTTEIEVIQRYLRAKRNDRHSFSVLQNGELAELVRIRKRYGPIKTVNDVLTFVRNSFLEASFGWKPLLSDLNAFFNIFFTVDQKVESLKNMNGRTRHLKWSRTYTIDPKDYTNEYARASVGGTEADLEVWCRAMDGSDIAVHGSCLVYQDLKDLDSILGTWRAVMASFGVNNPLKIGWNSIPYSFVADYFLKISNFLDALALQPFKGHWDVYNVCHSVTERTNVEVYLKCTNPDPRIAFRERHATTFAVRHYSRIPGIPGGVDSLYVNTPTEQQKLLIAALLDQKVWK
jgi:hypothetical protein